MHCRPCGAGVTELVGQSFRSVGIVPTTVQPAIATSMRTRRSRNRMPLMTMDSHPQEHRDHLNVMLMIF